MSANRSGGCEKQASLPGLGAVLLLILTFASCAQSDKPSQAAIGFDRVQSGQTTDTELVTLMGTPVRRAVRDFFGVQVQVWEFEDAKTHYTITLGSASFAGAGPRVIAKTMEPKNGAE
jgi:hypothetical protein